MKTGKLYPKNMQAAKVMETDSAGLAIATRPISSSLTGAETDLLNRAAVEAIAHGASLRRAAVLSIADNTAAPPTEVLGDRYILDQTGTSHADWDGAAQNDVVEFDGATWVAYTPAEGWITYVDDVNKDALFVDDGSPSWELRPAIPVNHADLLLLGADDHLQYHTDARA